MIYPYSFESSNDPKEKITTKFFSKSDAVTAV